MLVSIIINNYNYGRFLREAIESALNQSYPQVEVIIVDDGSTDNSSEIIGDYEHRIVPVFKENGGQASAFNAGVDASSGAIIIFLDADDILHPAIAERVVEAFHTQKGVAKVQYRLEVIDVLSRPTGEVKPALHLPLRSGDLRPYVLKFPYDLVWTATSGNAFSAKVLQSIFPVPEKVYGRVGADWYLSHLTPLFGPVIFLEEIGAYYRVHEANNYESASINLDSIRQTIKYMNITNKLIKQYSDQLQLEGRPEKSSDLLSVSYVANRLVSLKLEADKHPLAKDWLWNMLIDGIRASLRRFDISWVMKFMFVVWFIVMSVAPKPVARWLAEIFFFPQKREQLNILLNFLHKAG